MITATQTQMQTLKYIDRVHQLDADMVNILVDEYYGLLVRGFEEWEPWRWHRSKKKRAADVLNPFHKNKLTDVVIHQWEQHLAEGMYRSGRTQDEIDSDLSARDLGYYYYLIARTFVIVNFFKLASERRKVVTPNGEVTYDPLFVADDKTINRKGLTFNRLKQDMEMFYHVWWGRAAYERFLSTANQVAVQKKRELLPIFEKARLSLNASAEKEIRKTAAQLREEEKERKHQEEVNRLNDQIQKAKNKINLLESQKAKKIPLYQPKNDEVADANRNSQINDLTIEFDNLQYRIDQLEDDINQVDDVPDIVIFDDPSTNQILGTNNTLVPENELYRHNEEVQNIFNTSNTDIEVGEFDLSKLDTSDFGTINVDIPDLDSDSDGLEGWEF